ncbi:hypothetical protein RI367_003582 [Sorochytrium milnesiophthora]
MNEVEVCTLPDYSPHADLCCISLNRTDTIRVIEAPQELHWHIGAAVAACWSKGIQREGMYSDAYELKLNGNPWWGHQSESVSSRRLLMGVLSTMAQHGWRLFASANIGRVHNHKSSLMFERAMPVPNVSIFAVTFHLHDRLRVIGADQAVVNAIRDAIRQRWRIESEQMVDSAVEFKMHGCLWPCQDANAVYVRATLMQLLGALLRLDYKLYATIDVATGSDRQQNAGNWFFRKRDATFQ